MFYLEFPEQDVLILVIAWIYWTSLLVKDLAMKMHLSATSLQLLYLICWGWKEGE